MAMQKYEYIIEIELMDKFATELANGAESKDGKLLMPHVSVSLPFKDDVVNAMLPDLDIDKAEELALETDYACFAIKADCNEINIADAGAFFLEGYNYAKGLNKNSSQKQG